jgi:hypothetical protein
MIPKFQGLRCKGLRFGGLKLDDLGSLRHDGLKGLGLESLGGLEFESLVSNPSVLDLRPGLRGSGLETFLSFNFTGL